MKKQRAHMASNRTVPKMTKQTMSAKQPANTKQILQVLWTRKAFIWLSFAAIVIVGLATVALVQKTSDAPTTEVLTVNGEPVTKEELQKSMDEFKSVTFAYFVDKYGVKQDSRSFWTHSYNGEVPLAMLKAKAVYKLKETRVKQILAKQNGLESYLNYTDFKQKLVAENKRRTTADPKQLFGPVQYEERVYYNYVIGNMEEELRNKLSKSTLTVTESEEQKFYTDNKEQYKVPDSIQIDKDTVTFPTDPDSSKLQANQDKAKAIIEQMKSKIGDKGSFEEVAKSFDSSNDQNNGIKITYENHLFDEKSKLYDSRIPQVFAAAQTLPVGHISDIIEDKDHSFNLIKVNSRNPGGYKTFNEVKQTIHDKLVAQKYADLIAGNIKNAKVVFNTEAYGRITMD